MSLLKDTMQIKLRIAGKTIAVQLALLAGIFFIIWGAQSLYSKIDRTTFPQAFSVENPAHLSENEKGKLLLDAITNQMRRELSSTFGWSANDILFNRWVLDNRSYRQYGVYQATKELVDLYSTQIAKLGANDRENDFLYKARLNSFAIDPYKFWFPSAESAYKKGLAMLEQYKAGLDTGKSVYNCRTDDIYAAYNLVVGEKILGYALGLLNDAQNIPCYSLDNAIYQAQGIALVVRDFITALNGLYPEIAGKGNKENMDAAMDYLTRVCTYDPLYITSKLNSGELVISYLLFAKNRLEDVRDSIRI